MRSLAEVQNRGGYGSGVSRRWGWPAARGNRGKRERGSGRTLGWSRMGRGQPGGGSPATYRGGGHGSSAPAGSGEVGKGRLGLGASAF